MKERFYRELGRMIGTTSNPSIWARSFGCDPQAAVAIINELKAEGRCVERDGLLYRA